MKDIKITKVDETFIKVYCKDQYMELDLQDKFQFEIANAKYNPKVRYGNWDGIIKLYNRQTKKIYLGLFLNVLEFAKEQGWSADIDPCLFPNEDQLNDEDIQELVDLFRPTDKNGKEIVPYDIQLDALKTCLNLDRSTILAATSAGKSLIIWLLIRAYQLMEEFTNKRIVIVVPSVSLVEQMYSDFNEYSQATDWDVSRQCQRISGSYSKEFNRQIVITTWQSMIKQQDHVYDDIGAIIVDEVHGAKSSSLKTILEKSKTTAMRHGFTGTLDDVEVNELQIQGLFGPIKRVATAKDIIDRGIATKINITVAMLTYEEHIRKRLFEIKKTLNPQERYQKELEFLYAYQPRRNFILDMVASVSGNKLVLFDRVEEYGKVLFDQYKERYPDKKAHIIIGEVGPKEREEIRQAMEGETDSVIFATYQTMQQGVSIKNIHWAFFASSSKSKVRVLQSIGRTMRLHDSKATANIVDIVDDMTYNKESNFMLRQAQERISFYSQEKHPVKFDRFPIKEDSIDILS